MEFDYQFCQREVFGIRHCFVLINSLTENHQVIGKLDHLNKSVLFDDCQVLRNNDTQQLFVVALQAVFFSMDLLLEPQLANLFPQPKAWT